MYPFVDYQMDRVSLQIDEEFPTLLCTRDSLLRDERKGIIGRSRILSPHISRRDRAITVDWLIKVTTAKWLNSTTTKAQTFFATVNILDAVLSRDEHLTLSSLQLCAVACLWLACKQHEVLQPDLEDLVHYCRDAYTGDKILNEHRRVFAMLGCNVNIAQEMSYHREITTVSGASDLAHLMGKYLLYALTQRVTEFLPSVVVSAVRSLTAQFYQQKYVNYFNVPREVLDRCVEEIFATSKSVQHSNLTGYLGMIPAARLPDWTAFFSAVLSSTITLTEDMSEFTLMKYMRIENFRHNLSITLLDPAAGLGGVKLGAGTFGVVTRVVYQGKAFAVKRVMLNVFDDGIEVQFSREVSLMQSLRHHNIAQVRFITTDLESVFMELGDSDLHGWIRTHGPAGIDSQIGLCRQLLSALTYMHGEGCLHRDIKPQNIIVFEGGRRFVLSDLGGGRGGQIAIRGEAFTSHVCTLWYRSPELLMGARTYDDTLDVWSLLCTLYECAIGTPLFHGTNELEQVLSIFRVLGTPTLQAWPGVTLLSRYQSLSAMQAPPQQDFFRRNPRMSECYQALLTFGLVLDPSARPRAHELYAVSQEYIS